MRKIHTRAPNKRSLGEIQVSGKDWFLWGCLTYITEVRTIETRILHIFEFRRVNNISAKRLDVATAYSDRIEGKLSLVCSAIGSFLAQKNFTAGSSKNGEWKPMFLLNFSRFPSTFEAESRAIAKACIWKHDLHRMAWPLLNILFVLALARQWNWVGVTPETHVCGTFVKPCECTHDPQISVRESERKHFSWERTLLNDKDGKCPFVKKNSKENSLFGAPPGLLWLKHEWNKSSNSRPMLRKERWNNQWAINWY